MPAQVRIAMSPVVPKYGFMPAWRRAQELFELGPAVVDHLPRAGLADARRERRRAGDAQVRLGAGQRRASGAFGRRPDGRTIDPPAPFAMLPAQFERSGSRGAWSECIRCCAVLRSPRSRRVLRSGPRRTGVAIAGVPPPPLAVGDSFSVDEDSALPVDAPGLLANDNPGTATCVPDVDATGLIGEVEVQPNGAFTYTPAR